MISSERKYSFYKLSSFTKCFAHKKKYLQKLLNDFESKSDDVNQYLKNHALTDEKEKNTKTYLMVERKSNKIILYFTILTKSMSVIGIERSIRINLLNDARATSLNAILIAQLGKLNTKDDKMVNTEFIWSYIYNAINNLEFKQKFILIDCKKELKPYYTKLGFTYLHYDNLNKLHTLIRPIG